MSTLNNNYDHQFLPTFANPFCGWPHCTPDRCLNRVSFRWAAVGSSGCWKCPEGGGSTLRWAFLVLIWQVLCMDMPILACHFFNTGEMTMPELIDQDQMISMIVATLTGPSQQDIRTFVRTDLVSREINEWKWTWFNNSIGLCFSDMVLGISCCSAYGVRLSGNHVLHMHDPQSTEVIIRWSYSPASRHLKHKKSRRYDVQGALDVIMSQLAPVISPNKKRVSVPSNSCLIAYCCPTDNFNTRVRNTSSKKRRMVNILIQVAIVYFLGWSIFFVVYSHYDIKSTIAIDGDIANWLGLGYHVEIVNLKAGTGAVVAAEAISYEERANLTYLGFRGGAALPAGDLTDATARDVCTCAFVWFQILSKFCISDHGMRIALMLDVLSWPLEMSLC